MKTTYLIPAMLLGATLHTLAQGPPEGPPPEAVVRAIDKDRDHQISKREIKNATKQLLKLDEDEDGALSVEELKPERPKRRLRKDDDQNRPPAPPPSGIMEAIDTDKSGDLSKEEIEAASASLATLDKDEDGELSADEAGLKMPEDGPPGGGPGGQGGPDSPPRGGPRGPGR
ncbi:hypothetical protein [Haloferula sp.]|uniref:hypothetical protein n=1 Tax=Haloferula sp. TaxID=2497595 RepID=UPI003C73E69C